MCKKKRGRPKSKEQTKDKQVSIRLASPIRDAIIDRHGSIQVFFDLMLEKEGLLEKQVDKK